MAIIKIDSPCVFRHISNLGTGASAQRINAYAKLDVEYADEFQIGLQLAYSIDAPEMIPNGQTKRAHPWDTEPGYISRA